MTDEQFEASLRTTMTTLDKLQADLEGVSQACVQLTIRIIEEYLDEESED